MCSDPVGQGLEVEARAGQKWNVYWILPVSFLRMTVSQLFPWFTSVIALFAGMSGQMITVSVWQSVFRSVAVISRVESHDPTEPKSIGFGLTVNCFGACGGIITTTV